MNTINEAIAEARAFEKARKMETAGYTVKEVTEGPSVAEFGTFFQVTSPEGNVYGVDPKLPHCTCPSFAKNGNKFCKHTIFVKLMADKDEEEMWKAVAKREGVEW